MTYPDAYYMENERKFALGHRFFGMIPGLFLWNVIFLREHNRVCDVLRVEYPQWDDERLFQTSKMIIIGNYLVDQSTLPNPSNAVCHCGLAINTFV